MRASILRPIPANERSHISIHNTNSIGDEHSDREIKTESSADESSVEDFLDADTSLSDSLNPQPNTSLSLGMNALPKVRPSFILLTSD
jgi:hypothetical protein